MRPVVVLRGDVISFHAAMLFRGSPLLSCHLKTPEPMHYTETSVHRPGVFIRCAGTLLPVFLSAILLSFFTACEPDAGEPVDETGAHDEQAFDTGTEEDRAALFDYLVEQTMERDAFAALQEHPVKRGHPAGIDVIEEMKQHRDDLIDAETDREMWFALRKISNARRDRHLGISPVEGGLELPDHLDTEVEAPVSFKVDYGSGQDRFFFVADLAEDIDEQVDGPVPEPGDRVVRIEGRTTGEYVEAMRPYKRYSTEDPMWWLIGDEISRTWDTYYGYSEHLPHDTFYDGEPDVLSVELERRDGTRYEVQVPYQDPDNIAWQGHSEREYPGFSAVEELAGYETYRNVYLPDDGQLPVIIIDWFGFRGDLLDAMDHLMDYAEQHGLLDHHVIVDATRSRGGSNGGYALARLQPEMFRTTQHNLMVSDVSEQWVRDRIERWQENPPEPERGQNPVYEREWVENDALKAMEADQYFTNNAPFKGVQPPWGDAYIQPADRHFTGELTVWLAPHGGSHLDQFATQVKDNDLGHIMGMAAGGYSNSWSTSSVLRFPTTGEPIVEYEWSMGHSIRPNNKETVQYNPAQPDEYIPQTRDNFFDYHPMLLDRTLERLGVD